MKFKLLLFCFLLSSALGWGQFNIAAGSTNYTQDFNTLTNGAWSDNTTLTGWYANTSGGTGTTIASYGAGTGTTTTAGLYAFGILGTNPLSDRALGYYASNGFTGASGTGKGFMGWRLKNTTGSAITAITVTWTGEQWRRDNSAAQTLNLFYQNAATVTSLTAGTWTAAPSSFASPQLSATALALDGNTSANRTVNISVSITVNIPAGEEIMLRWEDLNDSGNDHSMAIDDVTVNATIGAACTSTTPVGTISGTTPACGNTSLSFSGTAVGPEVYYWQTSATGTSTANNASADLNVTTTGNYYVRTYNGSCWSASSVGPYAVTVNTPVAITTQPVNQSVTSPATAAFTVAATGTGLSYQWQVSTDGGGIWNNVSTGTGGTTASYTTEATATGMTGYLYRVVVSGAAPCSSVTSNSATLTVNAGPCLADDFESGNPVGWIINGTILGGQFCEGSQGLVFNNTGDNVITTAISNPQTLTFSKKRSGTADAWVFNIEVSASSTGPWTNVATINTITTACQTETIDLSAYTSGTYFIRFIDNRASGSAQRTIDDIQVFCSTPCTPAVVAVAPTSGPVGTEVTITASSGNLTGASVFFGGTSATVISNNGTQMIVVVPSGATTGVITITDSQPCDATTAFTLISNDNSSCEGASSITDLIIYDIHDEKTGSGGFITLYNGTAATVDLTNYSIYRTSTHDDGNEIDYANLTGTIAPGALGILKVSVGSCGPASTNGTIDGGFNENDGLQLRNAVGTVVVDDVDAYPTAPGYYMVRNAGALNARTSYVAADWITTSLIAGECYPSAGLTLPSGGIPPVVTTHPSYTPSCGSTSAVLNTAGTEGFAGGNILAYQWFFAAPGSATWTAVTNGGIYSGATTASLNISVITGVINYQYYCQIRENSATCYTASNAIKITDTSASTWNGTAWSNGVPTVTKLAVINGNYNTAVNGDFECCSLLINATFTLDIKDGDYVSIQNDLIVDGILEIQNQGSLIMINDSGTVTNNGTTNIRKMSTLFDRYDYTFWSSPIANAPISVFSQWQTNKIFKLNAAAFRDDNNDSHDDNLDAWVFTPQAEVMSPGRGYAAMGIINQTYPAQQGSVYSGAVNNGVLTQPIALSLDNAKANDDFNLIGNPYPSAISADAFITTNTDISGTLYFWTHEGNIQVAAVNPGPQGYNFSPDDFACYNLAGGTGTRAGLLTGNGNSNVPTGFIASGQGFQVDADAATSVTFNNSMRNKNHANTNFYRTASGPVEKDRIWLNLTNSEGIFSQQLVGFFPQATMGVDRGYDGFYTKSNTYAAFYSMIADKPYKIQGRSAFDLNDRIPLGFRSGYEKTYSISIGDIEGVLRNQNVYIEDVQLNIIHDLKVSNYVFSTPAGEFNNRFVLRFTNHTLSNDNFEANAGSVVIYTDESINVTSSLERIKEVAVYDVLGRVIAEKKSIDDNRISLTNVRKTQSALIVKVTLDNGQTVDRKVIY